MLEKNHNVDAIPAANRAAKLTGRHARAEKSKIKMWYRENAGDDGDADAGYV
jgi:hypothetical protein